MPTRLAETDPMTADPGGDRQRPVQVLADERIPGSRVVFAKNEAYVPAPRRHAQLQRRPEDRPCRPGGLELHSGPGDRLGRSAAGRDRLVGKSRPRPAAADQDLQGRHRHGEGPHRRDRAACGSTSCFRRSTTPRSAASCVAAMDQKEIMEGVAGAEPSLYKTDVGLFVPGTPMASTAGVEITRGPKDYRQTEARPGRRRLQRRKDRRARGVELSRPSGPRRRSPPTC